MQVTLAENRLKSCVNRGRYLSLLFSYLHNVLILLPWEMLRMEYIVDHVWNAGKVNKRKRAEGWGWRVSMMIHELESSEEGPYMGTPHW